MSGMLPNPAEPVARLLLVATININITLRVLYTGYIAVHYPRAQFEVLCVISANVQTSKFLIFDIFIFASKCDVLENLLPTIFS